MHSRPLRCPIQYLNEPSLTVGSTGCGKTTRARFWILQIAGKLDGLWLFDFRKREYGLLAPYLERVGVNLDVLPVRQLKLNLLQVPYGVDPRNFAPNISDAFVRCLKLPQRATKLLHWKVLELYETAGVLEGGQRYPTVFDLRKVVAADNRTNPQARLAVVDSLDPVLQSIGSILCYHYGWPTHELARRNTTMQMDIVRLLKSLCQTTVEKTVRWDSDARTLKSKDIPTHFSTTSRVAIIANQWKTLNEDVAAIEDRGHVVLFEPTPEEVHHRTAEWFQDGREETGRSGLEGRPASTLAIPPDHGCRPVASRRRLLERKGSNSGLSSPYRPGPLPIFLPQTETHSLRLSKIHVTHAARSYAHSQVGRRED